MSDPVSIGLLVASASASAIGAVKSAQMQSASYHAQEQAANYNASVEQQNATAAQAAASANELAQRRQNDQAQGNMRARAAQSMGGFGGTTGELLNQSAATMDLDALNIRYQGQMQARGLLAQANLDQYQAKVAGINAGQAKTAGYIGAAAGALGSVSSYYNFRSLYGSNYGASSDSGYGMF